MKPQYNYPASTILKIGASAYAYMGRDDQVLRFSRVDNPDDLRIISDDEFCQLMLRSDVRLQPFENHLSRKAATLRAGAHRLASIPEKRREVWVIRALARIRQDGLKRTESDIGHIIPFIEVQLVHLYRNQMCNHAKRAGQILPQSYEPPSACTLLRWIRRYEHGGSTAFTLVRKSGSGMHREWRSRESERLLAKCVEQSMTLQRQSISESYKACKYRYMIVNAERAANGEAPLPIPSLSTFHRRRKRVSKFEELTRLYGSAHARKQLRP